MARKIVLSAALLAAVVTAGASLQPVGAAAPEPNGETLFRQRCSMCHSVVASQPKTLAPNLNGVVGRKAAAAAFNYSPALKASNLTWTKPNLDGYLSGPTRMVQGTRMVTALPDPAQRAAIVRYLETKK